MSRDVNELVLWHSRVFASKLVLEDEMAGRLTAQSKEVFASVSEHERQKGGRI